MLEMKILTSYKELENKKIIFSHMPKYASHITLVTEDKGVLMAAFSYDEDEDQKMIEILYPSQVIHKLQNNQSLREELGKLGAFDIEAYKEQERLKYEKEKELAKIKREEKERAEYERLKAKFENE